MSDHSDDLDRRCTALLANGFDELMASWRPNALVAAMHWLDECESPIEKLMCAALSFGLHPDAVSMLPHSAFFRRYGDLHIKPQAQIEGYRVDFAVVATEQWATDLTVEARIVVECDGHDFHERTKEQAERDRSRDRRLTTLGWTVLRFTGREIVRDPRACATAVGDAIRAEYARQGQRHQQSMAVEDAQQ